MSTCRWKMNESEEGGSKKVCGARREFSRRGMILGGKKGVGVRNEVALYRLRKAEKKVEGRSMPQGRSVSTAVFHVRATLCPDFHTNFCLKTTSLPI